MNTKLVVVLCFLLFPVWANSDSNNVLTIGGIEMELGMQKESLLSKFTGKYQLIELEMFPGVVSLIDRDEDALVGKLWFKEGRLSSAAKNVAEIGGIEAAKFGDKLFGTIRDALEGSRGKAAIVAIETERLEGYTKDGVQLLIDNKLIKITIERSDDLEISAITVEEVLVNTAISNK